MFGQPGVNVHKFAVAVFFSQSSGLSRHFPPECFKSQLLPRGDTITSRLSARHRHRRDALSACRSRLRPRIVMCRHVMSIAHGYAAWRGLRGGAVTNFQPGPFVSKSTACPFRYRSRFFPANALTCRPSLNRTAR